MKNRMLKGAHLSERKCREILHYFCEDLTATQIAAITGVSRVTVNAYLKLIRTRLAQFCEDAFPPHHLPENVVSLKGSLSGLPKTSYFGFTRYNGHVYATGLENITKEHLLNWQKQYNGQPGSEMQSIQAVADFNNWRLYRRDMLAAGATTNGDEISGFWGLTRNRLMKFRGVNRNTLYLHIKECEFRYNHRNENMQAKLLQLINKHPLHEVQMQ
jgi:transposase